MKIARILANNSTSLDNLSVGDAGDLSHCYGEPESEGCRNNPPVLLSNPRAFFNVQIITMQSLGRALFNKISWSKLPFILSFVHEIILPEPPPADAAISWLYVVLLYSCSRCPLYSGSAMKRNLNKMHAAVLILFILHQHPAKYIHWWVQQKFNIKIKYSFVHLSDCKSNILHIQYNIIKICSQYDDT